MTSKDTDKKKPVGGLAFFSSLFFLLILFFHNLFVLPKLLSFDGLTRLLIFGLGAGAGALIGRYLIVGHASVFVHELKHKVFSGLVGNRAKRLKVAKDHGSFEYEYTKSTAAYNAFISLAPYWMPLFTILALVGSLLAFPKNAPAVLLICGLAYGTDMWLNCRDISPHQTDFSNLRGGFGTGVLYVIAMNGALFTILVAWVMADLHGITALVQGLGQLVYNLLGSLR